MLAGQLRVEFDGGELSVETGQAVIAEPGQWVRYSTPDAEGTEYVAVCLPLVLSRSAHHRRRLISGRRAQSDQPFDDPANRGARASASTDDSDAGGRRSILQR